MALYNEEKFYRIPQQFPDLDYTARIKMHASIRSLNKRPDTDSTLNNNLNVAKIILALYVWLYKLCCNLFVFNPFNPGAVYR